MFLDSLNLFGYFSKEVSIALIILVLTPLAAKIAEAAFFHLEKNEKISRKRDATKERMARYVTKVLIYLLGLGLIFYTIPGLRALSVGLFAGVGVLGIVVGLAAQDTLANIIAGISLAIFQPFRLGDRLKISGEYGRVEDITLRHTVIRTWENKRIIIPNHIISKEPVINYSITDEKILKFVDMSISYDSDIDFARKIMMDEVKKHPDVLDIDTSKDINTPELPIVRVRKLEDSGVTLRLMFWTKNQAVAVRTGYELQESIKKRFDKEGVEIPYPYRTIVYKKDLSKPKKMKSKKR